MSTFSVRRRRVRPADLVLITLPAFTTAAPAIRQNGGAEAADIVNDAALWRRDHDDEEYENYDDDKDKKDKDKDKDKDKEKDDDKHKTKAPKTPKTPKYTMSFSSATTTTTSETRPTTIAAVPAPVIGSIRPMPEMPPVSMTVSDLPSIPSYFPSMPPDTPTFRSTSIPGPSATGIIPMLPGGTALPEVSGRPNPSAVPVTGNSDSHVRMEIGIACGVVGAFLVIGIAMIFYLKRRRRASSVWSVVRSPFGGNAGNRRSIEPRSIPHAEYESRTTVDVWPPTMPDAVMLGANDIKRISDSPSDLERFATIKRKYTISRSIDMPREMPPPETTATRRDSVSSYTTMTMLPNISNSGFSEGFLEGIEKNDPFADPYSPSTASIPAPLPLRIPQKASANPGLAPAFQMQRSSHKYRGSDETLELTDPRVSFGGRLVITNRTRQDSVPSIPPSPPQRKLSRTLVPAPLRIVRPGQPPAQMQQNNKNAARRGSGMSVAESEGPARHRNVKSWVNHEADIRERYYTLDEVETPLYAKSEATLYNRLSLNSGMDTRRTEYEYYLGRR
ncbi:hypothetical protein Dda_2740 [Drechslerella dactyloides]|uniref:Uncharacterized protein n=1 Tax=Drechslerella dactyloides TaxID=74499 RepID=A0AAD6NJN7_DREDA|nr:hypothetical protein Dda_2740 [Drechslerella dactyloides]